MSEGPAPTLNCEPGPGQDPRAEARRLAEEIVHRWQTGKEAPHASKYLALHPGLVEHAEAGVHLVYEEACLRREGGDEAAYNDVLARYPQWRGQLEVMFSCHSLLEEQPAEPDWPARGDTLGDFRLAAELGRGGLGRVFLATQPRLAGRPVVLKVTPRTGQEQASLARLQHTHIVPLYSAEDDLSRNLRILCMPWFGGATLSRLLEVLDKIPPARRTGEHLLEALSAEQARWPLPLPGRGPARKMLARLSYVEAVCWMGACLADALQYAHERGLVHLDVKPSNVLLAADGEPMLLDFNVAQGPIRPDGPPPESLGGTPLYMPPEQEAAFQALKEGRPTLAVVDGRADVYALGRLLYEALGGMQLVGGDALLPLERTNPQVSTGLADIIARCLARRAEDRYQDAASLAADLRRHLTHQPLKGVANRSLRERWRKWRRRHPLAMQRWTYRAAMLIVLAGAALGLGLWQLDYRQQQQEQAAQQRQTATADLAEGLRHVQAGAYARAVDTLRHGLGQAEGVSDDELAGRLRAALARARRAEAAGRLHEVADRLRFLDGRTTLPRGEAKALGQRWQAVWDKRAWLLARAGAPLPAATERQLEDDLRDLGTLWADLRVRLAAPAEADPARRDALQVLAETEALFGPSAALCSQREACARALGRTEEARQAAKQAAALPPRSAGEHAALGRSLLEHGRLDEAAAALARATELDPGAFWPSFYQGVCAYRRGRYNEAVTAFRVCLALAPRSAECYCNRGLARAALADEDGALHDYDRALELDPRLGPAALNRGRLYYNRKRYEQALADLTRALRSGADPAAAHYNLALVHWARRDRPAALAELTEARRLSPGNDAANQLWERLTRAPQ